MKDIGIVSSPSSETEAQMVLNEGLERDVKVEDLVEIENRAGNKILAVCRKGTGNNANIMACVFSPGVAYAKSGRKRARNDRAILASIMPPRKYFAYEWLLGSPTTFNFYTTLRTAYEKMGVKKDIVYAEKRALRRN